MVGVGRGIDVCMRGERRRQDRCGSKRVGADRLSRASLQSLRPRLPGARILEGRCHATSTAVAVPKHRPAALAYVGDFVEAAKASGSVRRALDSAGLDDAMVAPLSAR